MIRASVSAHDINRAVEPLGKEYVNNAADLNGILDASLLQERLTSTVAGFFGLLALSLSAIGLYGLMSYSVVQRRREIGIRVALGGQIRRVTWQMLRAGLTVTVSGLAAGLTVAWMTTRLVGSLLFNACAPISRNAHVRAAPPVGGGYRCVLDPRVAGGSRGPGDRVTKRVAPL